MLIDTNVLLRYMLQDHAELSPKATQIIDNNDTICRNEVIYEAIHVLTKVYELDRKIIADSLLILLKDEAFRTNDTAITVQALTTYRDTSLDFIDCLLIAYHLVRKTTVISFDKRMNNYLKRHQ